MTGPPPRRADETALNFFTRQTYPVLEIPTVAPDGLRVGETIEVLGEVSTGKTLLLMDCCARCILPKHVGGQSMHAIIVDSEGGFSMPQLTNVLLGILKASNVISGEAKRDQIIAESLTRLRVMQTLNAEEMLLGLSNLRCECEVPLPHMSPDEIDLVQPRLLIIDSASTFAFLDRTDPHRGCGADAGFQSRLSELIGQLRKQRLTVVWSRCPLVGHDSGREFPPVDRPITGVQAPSELGQPSLRLRLRRLRREATGANATGASNAAPAAPPMAAHPHIDAGGDGGGGMMHAFQVLLDRLGAPANGALSAPGEPPLRREMHVDMDGVVHVVA